MSFIVGDEDQLFNGTHHDTVMTFMEATSDEMHDTLNDIISGQTHYRLVLYIFISINIFLTYLFTFFYFIFSKKLMDVYLQKN